MKLKLSQYIHNNSNITLLLEREKSPHYFFMDKIYRKSGYKRFYNKNIECLSLYKNAGIYFDHHTFFIYAI